MYLCILDTFFGGKVQQSSVLAPVEGEPIEANLAS